MGQPRKRKAAKGPETIDTAQTPAKPAAHANGTSIPSEGNGDQSHSLHAKIAALAYELYERRGRWDGYDVEDWLKAEEQIRREADHARRV